MQMVQKQLNTVAIVIRRVYLKTISLPRVKWLSLSGENLKRWDMGQLSAGFTA